MLSHQREVSDILVYGDKLLKDSELPEDDRTAIQKEVLDLSHRWENLEELVSWKTDRYVNLQVVNKPVSLWRHGTVAVCVYELVQTLRCVQLDLFKLSSLRAVFETINPAVNKIF